MLINFGKKLLAVLGVTGVAGILPAAAGSADCPLVTVYNASDNKVHVYWMATGCAEITGRP